jgi:AcrR family transcriptional regulator
MAVSAVSGVADVIVGDRRTQILDCAAAVIARDGVDGLRMAAVAAEAEVSSALLHYYFSTREELVRLAFERFDELLTQRSADELAAIADPVARVRHVLQDELSEDPQVMQNWVLWLELEHYAAFHADARAMLADRSARWIGAVSRLVADAQAAGRVSDEIDAGSAGLRLTCVVDGLCAYAHAGVIAWAQARLEVDAAMRDILRLGRGRA